MVLCCAFLTYHTLERKNILAIDIGEWRDKHIDIFTGYGLEARANAYKITKLPSTESSRVLATGFKEIKP